MSIVKNQEALKIERRVKDVEQFTQALNDHIEQDVVLIFGNGGVVKGCLSASKGRIPEGKEFAITAYDKKANHLSARVYFRLDEINFIENDPGIQIILK